MSKLSRTGRRGAPPIAAENAARARENIERKLQAIQLAVTSRSTEIDAITKLPRTLRQFNLWAVSKDAVASEIPHADVKRNSNETLNGHAKLKSQVVSAVQSVARVLVNAKQDDRGVRAVGWEEKFRMSERIREILDAGMKRAARELEAANEARRRAEAVKHATEQKAKESIEELERELAEERKKVSDLTKLLQKTVRLGRAK